MTIRPTHSPVSASWKTQLCLALGLTVALVAPAIATTEPFTTAGTYTWTAPTGVTSVTVEAWGGGGGGGAATVDASNGGGGAGGQYAKKVVSVTAGSSYTIVVGAGGTVSTSAAGSSGGASTFASTTVVAKGGAGGGLANTDGGDGTAGAGTTTGGVGDTVYAGGSGTAGNADTNSCNGGGGGGGGAGSTGAGGAASGITAGTGTSSGGGNGGDSSKSSNNGSAGSQAGGGGGGGCAESNTDRSGGAGGAGKVVLTYVSSGSGACTTGSVGTDVLVTCTGDGNITIPSGVTSVRYLVVGGGGGGGGIDNLNAYGGGGGGAGGLLSGTALAVTAGSSYAVTVGAGGTAGVSGTSGGSGSSSSFSSITAAGGGGGASKNASSTNGIDGASGGGGRGSSVGGSGTSGQGSNGGTASGSGGAGGGGGKSTVGSAGSGGTGGAGGAGTADTITGSSVTYAGGGGGGGYSTGGTGGAGGGGSAPSSRGAGIAGTANRGGGGSGASGSGSGSAYSGGAGGSGIVIIRYTPGSSSLTCTTDTFTGTDNSPPSGWVVGKSAGTFDPTIVSNRLRLTDTTTNAATSATVNKQFPAAGNKLIVSFDHLAYGGTGGDGIALVLSDASKAPVAGGYGGSMGYAPRTTGTAHAGFTGGWLGIALDEYGNFANASEGRSGGSGFVADAVTLRGSASASDTTGYAGYSYIKDSASLSPGIDGASSTGINYIGVGTVSAVANGSVSPGLPTYQTNDLLMCLVESHDSNSHSTPTGWTQLYSLTSGTTHRASLYYKIATASESTPTITHTDGNSTIARCFSFRGVDTSSPFDVTYQAATNASSNTVRSGTQPSVTSGRTVLFATHIANNPGTNSVTSTGSLTWTQAFHSTTASGNDSGISLFYATKGATTGSLGPIVSSTNNNAGISTGALLVLKPASAAGPNYNYRVTLDYSDSTHAYTTVERDTGSGYTTVIPTFDAKPSLASVPTNWLLSFTGASNGSTNIHEIDNLTLCATSVVTPTLDHLQIDHDASGVPNVSETLTIKACADSSCSSLYLGSVTATLSGTTWSPASLAITGGQGSATITRGTTGTDRLAATTSPSTTTQCFNGTTTNSTTACDFVWGNPSFDALETGVTLSTTTNRLYTKLAGTAFSLDIAALASGALNTAYTGAVKVDLIDGASACTTTATSLQTVTASYTFTGSGSGKDNGRHTFSGISYASPASNVKVRIVSGSTATCSSDKFSIRPAKFLLSNSVFSSPWAAGEPFTLTATATNSSGTTLTSYTGTPSIDAAKLTIDGSTAITTGTFVATMGAASSGVTTATDVSYNDVGSLVFGVDAVNDAAFTTVSGDLVAGDCVVDSSSNTAVSGKFGCLIGNTATLTLSRFRVHHYEVTMGLKGANNYVDDSNTGWTYMGQPGLIVTLQIDAMGKTNPTPLSQYKTGFANLATLTLVGTNDNGTSTITLNDWLYPNLPGSTWSAGSYFANGTGDNTISGASFNRSSSGSPAGGVITTAAAGIGPYDNFKLQVAVVDADANLTALTGPLITMVNGVAQSPAVQTVRSAATKLRFGRLRLSNTYGSELLPVRVPVAAEYWNSDHWETNTLDSVTQIKNENLSLVNYKGALSSLSTPTNPAMTLDQGAGTLIFPAAGATNIGSVDVAVDLTSSTDASCNTSHGGLGTSAMPWLQGYWGAPANCNSAAAYAQDPSARIKVGSPKAPYIYMRENY